MHIPRFAPSGLKTALGLPQNDAITKASHFAEKAKEQAPSGRGNPFVGRLSMRKWDYDPAKIIEHLDDRK